MEKDKNKGLADTQEGEFILNESGTSVTIDADLPEEENEADVDQKDDNPSVKAKDTEEMKDKQ